MLELQADQEPLVKEDLQDWLDPMVLMVYRVILGQTDSKDLLVMLVNKDFLDLLEQQVLQETKVSLEMRASQVFKDPKVLPVNQDQLDHVVLVDHQDQKDNPARQVSLAKLAHRDLLDL